MKSKRILIVEDELIVGADLEARLRTLGYEPVGVTGLGEQAVALAAKLKADLVLMDIQLKGAVDGITAADQIRTSLEIPVVFLTAHADEATLRRAKITSPFGYVVKPFTDRELHVTIEIAIERHASEGRLKRTQQWLTAVIESVGDGLVVTDEWGLVQLMNRAARALSSCSLEQAFLKPFSEVFECVDVSTLKPVHFPIPKTNGLDLVTPAPRTVKFLGRAGETAFIGCSAAPIRDANGQVRGMLWMLSPRTLEETLHKGAGVA